MNRKRISKGFFVWAYALSVALSLVTSVLWPRFVEREHPYVWVYLSAISGVASLRVGGFRGLCLQGLEGHSGWARPDNRRKGCWIPIDTVLQYVLAVSGNMGIRQGLRPISGPQRVQRLEAP